ncbi:MAG: beta-galactosidase [Opitutaceae bacterium]|nr:beta-galactosidase [Opitutaceae bacterium]
MSRPAKPVTLVLKSLVATGSPSTLAADADAADPDTDAILSPKRASVVASPKGSSAPSAPEMIRFDDPAKLPEIRNLDSKAEVIDGKGGKLLKVAMGAEKPYPNVVFAPKNGSWNLTPYTRVEVDLVNLDTESIQVEARLDNPGASSKTRSNGGKLALDPGESGTLVIQFAREFAGELREKLIGMQHTPWGPRSSFGGVIDPSNLVEINLYMNRPSRPHTFAVAAVRAAGTFDPASLTVPEPFFPFIDTYGQYRHTDWLNKIKTPADFARIKAEEAKSIGEFPRPASWNLYGGWANGPQLKKTGHFYTTKLNGKWHLVDPDGRLFFSMGIDVVQAGLNGGTPIDERDGWFGDAPWESDGQFKSFIKQPKETTRGDYKGKTPRLFNFFGANLLRKYGSDWENEWCALMPRRLNNWGFNTIGNWSDPEILSKGKIPYTHWVFLRTQKLPWMANTRNPVPDPFNPMFEPEVRRATKVMTKGMVDDPYCIGFFVDNELTWHDEDSQGKAAMAGDARSYAKLELLKDLRATYGEIDKLNASWRTSFASWDAMVDGKDLPKTAAGREDLKKFGARLAHKYFGTIRTVLREIAPNKLYLGCRFAENNPQIVAICAEYCDVVSFNIYREKVADWNPPVAIDKPVIIGEFHFGANDRGVFGRGLVKAESTEDRAKKFLTYITGAAENPILVGAHWFALVDEPTSGRHNDQENHGFGFLSITDTPYQEMIDASRKAAGQIYTVRAAKKN